MSYKEKYLKYKNKTTEIESIINQHEFISQYGSGNCFGMYNNNINMLGGGVYDSFDNYWNKCTPDIKQKIVDTMNTIVLSKDIIRYAYYRDNIVKLVKENADADLIKKEIKMFQADINTKSNDNMTQSMESRKLYTEVGPKLAELIRYFDTCCGKQDNKKVNPSCEFKINESPVVTTTPVIAQNNQPLSQPTSQSKTEPTIEQVVKQAEVKQNPVVQRECTQEQKDRVLRLLSLYGQLGLIGKLVNENKQVYEIVLELETLINTKEMEHNNMDLSSNEGMVKSSKLKEEISELKELKLNIDCCMDVDGKFAEQCKTIKLEDLVKPVEHILPTNIVTGVANQENLELSDRE